jgi:hypothetical protein
MVLRDTIQTNERELRRWDHALVNEMVDAVVFSLPALEPWMPRALTSLGANERRVAFAKGGTILTREKLGIMVFSGEIPANSSSRRVCTVKSIVIVPRLATGSERIGPKRAGPPSPPARSSRR